MKSVPGIIAANHSINQQDKSDEKTLLVVGDARGGTSLVAGLLYHLGIPMGQQCDKPIYEDGVLTRAIRSGQRQAIRDVISSYNQQWPVWGFKQPSVQKYLLSHYRKFRNPHYLFIVKDPASIAIRKNTLYDYEAIQTMRKTLKGYDRILKFIQNKKVPALIISYEKLYSTPDLLLPELYRLIGEKQPIKMSVATFFSEGKQQYQQFFENQLRRKEYGIEGHIDQTTPQTILGWALHTGSHTPIEVYFEVNEKQIGKVIADQLRPDLKKLKLHPTGNCGYEFKIPTSETFKNGDILRAFAGIEKVELSRSPWKIDNNTYSRT